MAGSSVHLFSRAADASVFVCGRYRNNTSGRELLLGLLPFDHVGGAHTPKRDGNIHEQLRRVSQDIRRPWWHSSALTLGIVLRAG